MQAALQTLSTCREESPEGRSERHRDAATPTPKTHSQDVVPTQLPAFIKSQTYTAITSCLRPSVYQAPSDGAEIPPQAPQTHWGSGLRGRAGGTRSSPGQGTSTLGQLGYTGPPRPAPFMLTARREKEAGKIPSPGRDCRRERAESGGAWSSQAGRERRPREARSRRSAGAPQSREPDPSPPPPSLSPARPSRRATCAARTYPRVPPPPSAAAPAPAAIRAEGRGGRGVPGRVPPRPSEPSPRPPPAPSPGCRPAVRLSTYGPAGPGLDRPAGRRAPDDTDFSQLVPRSDSAQEFPSLGRTGGSPCPSLPGPRPSLGSWTRSRES
ncbi:proline-rich protein 2-like [Oenanthe melanoleuca]|uniref:proline-rich protein 2-like n=1 Tax=Oenanthe melanoleuca TaxID=2939378 RepID=UPI0024C10692|nr:proline-rich protein 2-like [Oenanthe melanoleuca]